ncbi:LRR receptor-like serine/threonine-protein kinase RGI2 [Sorochytrium milnesiophthora]
MPEARLPSDIALPASPASPKPAVSQDNLPSSSGEALLHAARSQPPAADTVVQVDADNVAPSEADRTPRSKLRRLRDLLVARWFLIGIVVVVLLAYAAPSVGRKKGVLRSEYSIKYGAVIVIFLISGLGLKSRVLAQTMLLWKLHLVVQTMSLIVTPTIGFGISKLLGLTGLNDALVAGLTIASCLPTTISSNVVMTKQAGGNEAASLINATIGNILGILISPLLLLLFLGARTTVPFGSIFLDLTYTVLIPLFVGQLVQLTFPNAARKLASTVNLSHVSSMMLLLLVYATFCDQFSDPHATAAIKAGAVVAMIAVIVCLYQFNSWLCFLVSRMLRFDKPDTVSIVYCGATKTMALGIPLIGIVYRTDPNVGLYSLPLLMYHATQLFVGGAMTDPFLRWTRRP